MITIACQTSSKVMITEKTFVSTHKEYFDLCDPSERVMGVHTKKLNGCIINLPIYYGSGKKEMILVACKQLGKNEEVLIGQNM